MKCNKQLDEKLGISHIKESKDLPKLKGTKEPDFKDPEYPYDSKYTKQTSKKEMVEVKVEKKTLWSKLKNQSTSHKDKEE